MKILNSQIFSKALNSWSKLINQYTAMIHHQRIRAFYQIFLIPPFCDDDHNDLWLLGDVCCGMFLRISYLKVFSWILLCHADHKDSEFLGYVCCVLVLRISPVSSLKVRAEPNSAAFYRYWSIILFLDWVKLV